MHIWDNSIYEKKMQVGNELGERILANAFKAGNLMPSYEKIIIIGSDMYD